MAVVKKNLSPCLTENQFWQIASIFSNHYGPGIELVSTDGAVIKGCSSRGCRPGFCKQVERTRLGKQRCRQDRIRSLNFAFETGQPYISFCHAGIMMVCVAIVEADKPLGGIFWGRSLSEEISEVLANDISKKLADLPISTKQIPALLKVLPVLTAKQIHEASEFLFLLLYETTKLDSQSIDFRRQKTLQQARIGEFIQNRKNRGGAEKYPYQRERELIEQVKIGDKTGAREILNEILGSIMLRNPGQINVLKARLFELLGVLSRSAAEGGVDIDNLLEKNLEYISKVVSLEAQEDICVWISKALHDFIDSVYAMHDNRKAGHIKRAIDFMEQNYDREITLSDIAKSACLSVSRLAHLFKDEMGMTVFDYLLRVRINQAKHRLLASDDSCTNICFEVGFNHQSYFTRTFKKITGMTPREFRKCNRQQK